MKTRVIELPYSEVCKIKPSLHLRPVRQSVFLRRLMQFLARFVLKSVHFSVSKNDMDRLKKNEPVLYLMNHSSFTDLEITSLLLGDGQYHIVCTNDGLVGKPGLMLRVGCIPAKKFISDMYLIKDMKYAVDKLGSSILMFPEASYSFDGCETPLPDSLGKFLKVLGIPVVMIRTKGSFLRDPLYNGLQQRKVKVSANMYYMLSAEDVREKSAEELNAILQGAFEIDNFKEQYESGTVVDEPFRADGLNRVLYKCPKCHTEGEMHGEGIHITCRRCGLRFELTELGKLEYAPEDPDEKSGGLYFDNVPEWYRWERDCVRKEIEDGSYLMDLDTDIYMMVDYKAIYKVGEGRLVHDCNGFTLTGCDGQLNFRMSPKHSYSLYADYYWYELGDMIAIGDTTKQFYCIPKDQEGTIVAKARLAAEEMYKKAMSELK
ncbi:MAG: 1-acyl-sn-glycerol-3-phosphate acyltransferase [Lachnospiraceae bacterium]|nr:1-acyl-sn-glycerol-3-phosphate acyltransferase [Lachnospiraceae bacterium]